MVRRSLPAVLLAASALTVLVLDRATPLAAPQAPPAPVESTIAMHADPDTLFKTGGNCMPCHNRLTTPSGEDVSIGLNWRATIMANSSRDPYWQAGVRRETIDHPSAAADIEDECSICHMPMASAAARAKGQKGRVFAHLPVNDHDGEEAALAHDGVSCTLCHQIAAEKLGTRESFVGGFAIAGPQAAPRPVFGRFDIERGLKTIMRSSSDGFQPTQGPHIAQSALCATCHTLITKALDAQGRPIGELPEQVMFQEWQHSAYATEERTCQSCHMPVVEAPMPIASVLATPRAGFSRHVFVGGNFFMLNMLNRYRTDLGVQALPVELNASAQRTVANLQAATATIAIESLERAGGRFAFDVVVRDLTGHKFPTGYPARRAWLHVTVRDAAGRTVFESGAITARGEIQGNANDADPSSFEPHYTQIEQPDQVQIYESIMGDSQGRPTTGLLSGVRYLKDNRLLPRGFDKSTADPWIAVVGGAREDADFTGSGDRVHYAIGTGAATGPLTVAAELRFQPIGYRWAHNLEPYDAPETSRFVGYYESMSAGSSEVVAKATSER